MSVLAEPIEEVNTMSPLAVVDLFQHDTLQCEHWGDGLLFAYGLTQLPVTSHVRYEAHCRGCHRVGFECTCDNATLIAAYAWRKDQP